MKYLADVCALAAMSTKAHGSFDTWEGVRKIKPVVVFGRSIAKMLMIIAVTFMILAACSRTPTPVPGSGGSQPPEPTPVIVVAMGDSLTEGLGVDPNDAYPAQLERRLQAEGYGVRVVNSGSSGETSSGALSRVDWVFGLQPDVLILATGANDGLRGIDPGLTQRNIDEIVKRFLQNDVVVVLAGMTMVENMGKEYTSAFQAIYPAVASKYDVVYVPFPSQSAASAPNLSQADSIHPNADGYAAIVDWLYPYVVEAMGQLPSGR